MLLEPRPQLSRKPLLSVGMLLTSHCRLFQGVASTFTAQISREREGGVAIRAYDAVVRVDAWRGLAVRTACCSYRLMTCCALIGTGKLEEVTRSGRQIATGEAGPK